MMAADERQAFLEEQERHGRFMEAARWVYEEAEHAGLAVLTPYEWSVGNEFCEDVGRYRAYVDGVGRGVVDGPAGGCSK